MLHHQRTSLRELLADHVWAHSAFYRDYYGSRGIKDKDLVDLTVRDLPFVSKNLLMEHFDTAVTDPRIRKEQLQQWAQDNPGQVRYGEFLVICTSGSSGDIGIFVYDQTAVNVMNGRMVERLPAPENYPSGKTRCACFMNTAAALMPTSVFEAVVLSLLDSSEEVVGRLNTFQPHRRRLTFRAAARRSGPERSRARPSRRGNGAAPYRYLFPSNAPGSSRSWLPVRFITCRALFG